MATSIPLFNTDPNIQAQAALLQQRQALAQELMKQGLSPLESNRSIGGVAYHVSPFEGLAKVLQGYGGQSMMQDAVGQQAQLASQAYASALQSNQPGTGASYTPEQFGGAMDAAIPPTPGGGPPAPADIAKALQGQSPANPGTQNPRNPLGMPAELLTAYQAGMIPKEVFDAQAALFKPTDATLAARQGGLDPMQANRTKFQQGVTDPKIWAMQQAGMTPEQINQAVSGEADKARTMEGRPGQSLYTFGGNGSAPQLRAVSPDPSNNMQFGVGPGGQVSAQPVPGAVPNKSSMAGGTAASSAAGTTANTLHEVTLDDGKKVKVLGRNITAAGIVPDDANTTLLYQNEMKTAQQRLASATTPEDKARFQSDIDGLTREMAQRRIPLQQGQSTANAVVQTASGTTLSALPQQVTQTKQTVVGLENALKTLESLKSGPGVSKSVNALAIVNNMGIPLMTGDTNGYQTLKKFLENAAASAGSSTGATRTDAQFEQFRAGQPNAETMNPKALEGAIRYVLSQQDAALHNGNYVLQKAGNDASKVQAARQEWSKQYNPRYFEVQRLSPTDQAAAVNAMKPADAAAFLAWRKAQKGN